MSAREQHGDHQRLLARRPLPRPKATSRTPGDGGASPASSGKPVAAVGHEASQPAQMRDTKGVASPSGTQSAVDDAEARVADVTAGGPPWPAPPTVPEPVDELPRRQLIATLAGVMMAMLLGALDQTIVGTAMPRVIADLHGFEQYGWVVTAYLVTSTAVVPIAGKLSDIYGRKLFLLAGVMVFLAGSVVCGASQTMTQLVIFRGIQGLGAGLTQAMAFTTIADLFPPARRGRVSGLFGAVFGLSSVIGPTVGGFLTDGPGWRWVFYVNIPLGLLSLATLYFFFPTMRRVHDTRPKIDVLGAITLVLAVVPLLVALSWGGREYAWSSLTVVGLLVFAAAMTALFLRTEMHAPEPIIPLSLFKNRIVAVSVVLAGLTSVGMFGTVLFIPLFIQGVIGTNATKSGAVMTPMMLSMIVTSIGSGQLISRLGRYRIFAITGIVTTTFGLFLLSRMGVDTTYGIVVRNMIVLGFGLGQTMPVFTLAVQNAVSQKQVGTATSSTQFFRSMGGALGAAIFGSVMAGRFSSSFREVLSPEVAQAIPPAALARIDNPQALLAQGPAALQSLAGTGPQSQAIAQELFRAVRLALAMALHDVFFAATMVLAVAVVLVFFLKDIPLRGGRQRTVPEDAGGRQQSPASAMPDMA